jgi:peptidoglycan/LPS O-acetylase OafA/YrhL
MFTNCWHNILIDLRIRMRTVSEFCHAGQNSFGLVRLLAAAAVVLSHSYVITLGPDTLEPLEALTGYPLGAHAVYVFFTVSGLLVAASFERRPNILAFGAARFFRIYPGLIAATVLVFLLCTLLAGTADFGTALRQSITSYFAKILIGLAGSGTIPGVFETLPEAERVNVPLWTLKYEVISYIGLGLVMAVIVKTRWVSPAIAATAIIAISGAWLLQGKAYNDSNFFDHVAQFSFSFWIGVLAWHLRAKVQVRWEILLALFAFTVGAIYFEMLFVDHFLMLLSGYLALFVAQFRFGKITEFTDKNDLSYGVYILGWPVQQMLVLYGIGTTPIANTLLALIIVIPVAFLSWRLVEKPSLRLKDRFA